MSARPELPPLPVRPMTEYDLHEVAAIEQDVYAFPWSHAIFKDCLRVGYCAVVLESDEGIRGYAVMSSAVGEAHLLNICIHPAWHGCGIGRQLLDWMFQEARCLGARRIFLEVRPSNTIALQLYEATGFARIGLRKAYYRSETGREDAIVLEHRLDPA